MKPSKLLRHLESMHPALKGEPLGRFERKKCEGQKQLLRITTSTNGTTMRASYLVANRIAKAKKPFVIMVRIYHSFHAVQIILFCCIYPPHP